MYEKFSPYRLLNTNLVSDNRKNGVQNVEKYLFLLLSSLRRMTKCKKSCLFRCISNSVKLEKDPNNNKFGLNIVEKNDIITDDGGENEGFDAPPSVSHKISDINDK